LVSKLQLQNVINNPGLSRKDAVLLLLAYIKDNPKQVKELIDLGKSVGVRTILKWNISQTLISAKGLAVKVQDGWQLTDRGIEYVTNIPGLNLKRPAIKNLTSDLKSHVSLITNQETQAFLIEAISCFENGNYRAAAVLSWVGAIHILFNHVINSSIVDFNNEASKRDPKWKKAKTIDDLGRIKEKDFLEILVSISVLGKNVKTELSNCLDLRNGCGHPNTLKIGENRIASHLETLILNVYTKF
jgi:hypothetical protein